MYLAHLMIATTRRAESVRAGLAFSYAFFLPLLFSAREHEPAALTRARSRGDLARAKDSRAECRGFLRRKLQAKRINRLDADAV